MQKYEKIQIDKKSHLRPENIFQSFDPNIFLEGRYVISIYVWKKYFMYNQGR